jgi:hypothetical protein
MKAEDGKNEGILETVRINIQLLVMANEKTHYKW